MNITTAAKTLMNMSAEKLTKAEFKEYITSYKESPKEYGIEVDSNYYKAIEIANENVNAVYDEYLKWFSHNENSFPATFTVHYDTGVVEATTSQGVVSIHPLYDNNANIMPGIAFNVTAKDPNDSVYLSPEDLQKLFEKYNLVSNNLTTYKLQII